MDDSVVILIFLSLAIIILLFIFADKKRHEFPRSVLFFYSLIPFAVGLGVIIWTYLDFTHNEVHPIFFKTATYTYTKFDSPITFIVGLAFNVLFGLIFAAAGLRVMFNAITNTNFRFKK